MKKFIAILASASVTILPSFAFAQEYVPPANLDQRMERSRHLAENAFDLADGDGDGRLSLAEWTSKEWLVYSEFDHDRNGRLDAEEFQDKQCGGLGEDIPSQPPMRQWCLSSATRDFRRLSGFRGAITLDSLTRQARQGFRFNDLNRDGFVTREEQRLAIERRR